MQIARLRVEGARHQRNSFESDFSEVVADSAIALIRVKVLLLLILTESFVKNPLVEMGIRNVPLMVGFDVSSDIHSSFISV